MITLKLNVPLLALDGTETDAVQSKLVADLLCTEVKGPALRLYEWAQSLFKTGSVTFSTEDYDILYSIVEKTDRLMTLAKGQILLEMKKCKEASEKDERTGAARKPR